jgi:glycosyltransferase involved in cell wall biosynthesis
METSINKQKIVCIALLDKIKSPGVYKKILGTIAGAEQAGYYIGLEFIDPTPGFLKRFVEKIDNSNGDILLIRSLCQYNFYLIPALRRAKAKGKKIILDVPTPNTVAVKELGDGNTNWNRKVKDLAYLILSGPVPFWYVSKILQYSDEGSWFSLGNKKRTSLIGNGIQVAAVPQRALVPEFNGTDLKLICVASLNYWHGIDRLIKAISIFNAEENIMKVHLKIVGKGAALSNLVDLADTLGINSHINFLGFLDGKKLYDEYETAHLAVGSLALFRKKLKSASELKSREYCAVGIPFISVGEDFDFPSDTRFRIVLPNRENIEDLVNFFRNFSSGYLSITPKEIRDFALENLDYSAKMKKILCSVAD